MQVINTKFAISAYATSKYYLLWCSEYTALNLDHLGKGMATRIDLRLGLHTLFCKKGIVTRKNPGRITDYNLGELKGNR